MKSQARHSGHGAAQRNKQQPPRGEEYRRVGKGADRRGSWRASGRASSGLRAGFGGLFGCRACRRGEAGRRRASPGAKSPRPAPLPRPSTLCETVGSNLLRGSFHLEETSPARTGAVGSGYKDIGNPMAESSGAAKRSQAPWVLVLIFVPTPSLHVEPMPRVHAWPSRATWDGQESVDAAAQLLALSHRICSSRGPCDAQT